MLVASGCGGTGRELAAYADLDGLGGFVTRSITVNARPAAPTPRIVETPSGLVNAVGLQNPGIDHFLATELPWLAQQGVRVFVSIAGRSLGEYAELARRLGRSPGRRRDRGEPVGARRARHRASSTSASRSTPPAWSPRSSRDLPRGMPVLAKIRSDVVRVVESARTVARRRRRRRRRRQRAAGRDARRAARRA